MDPIVTSSAAVPPAAAPDVVGVETTPRPTPRPVGAPFSEVLAGSARALVRGATAAVHALPGAPLMAVALRGGVTREVSLGASSPEGPIAPPYSGLGPIASAPGALGSGVADGSAAGTGDPSISSTLAQDQEMNLYYLQIQEEVNAQNRTYSALSNVMEVEHNTAKTAIGNIH